MANYEPFLINPPKRLGKLRMRFRRNDYSPGMEEASPDQMGIGVRSGHTSIHTRKSKKKEKLRKRAKKAWRTRRKHEEAKVATRRKKVARKSKAKKSRFKKGSLAAKRFMAKLRSMRKTSKRKVRKTKVRRTNVRRTKTAVRRKKVAAPRMKRRGFAKRHKRKLVSVYRYGGAWKTSPFSRRPIKPGIKVNPFRRNPFGEELMVVGSNPRRRKRRKYSMNPRRKGGYMASRRRRRHSSKRRRFTSNPMSSIKSLMPMVIAGTGGALATKMVPRLLGMTSTWSVIGTQAAVVVGGGYALDKYVGKNVSDGFIIGGAAYLFSNVLSTFVGGALAGLGLDYTENYGALPGEFGALPGEQLGMLGADAYMDGTGDLNYGFEPTAVI